MGVLCLDYSTEDTEGKSAEGSSTSDSSDVDDRFGDPQVVPRVGDQYQAEIPPLNSVPCVSLLTKQFRDSEVGLPISLVWAYCKVESKSETLESVISEEGQVISENDCSQVKVEPLTTLLGEGKNVRRFLNSQSSLNCQGLKFELDQEKGMYLLPGLSGESWTVLEYNCFLLGLYAFGKNFNIVKRFVGTKNMGEMLSFYYGKFYRSEGYRRWSDCRKLKNKRCIYGQKIFMGWRQQELLSRLFSHISGECHSTLVELCRNFAEGKISFQEYVFALKDTVGIALLIDAVGIGKGKQDLTGTAVEQPRMSHIFSVRPEIPIGKACSSLTSADIIKFLTGGFRLSKARSSDLFWEAVWPRLLAKGWRSEQPKDYVVSGSKQPLVFLTPGVKKFSRWKLVKGNHYFDSVSDVLNKVASDPGLLESETKVTDKENRQDKHDLDGLSNKQQKQYLQPLSSNCNQMKFTIVDTSIVYGLEKRKVRELRSLPIQTIDGSTLMGQSSSESDQDTSEETEEQAEQTNSLTSAADDSSGKGASAESKECNHMSEALNANEVAIDNHISDSSACALEADKFQLFQNVTSGCSNSSPPVDLEELNHSTESTPKGMELDLNESISPLTLCDDAPEGLVLSVDLQNDSNEAVAYDQEVCAEKPEPRMLIDLNLPHVSPEMEISLPSTVVILQNNDNQCASKPSEFNLNQTPELPNDHQEQQAQSMTVNRRQSTRNRPLTTKAWEAFEYDFFNSKKKRKNVEYSNHSSKSQCIRATGNDDGSGNVVADTIAENENENEIGACESGSSINLNVEPHYNL